MKKTEISLLLGLILAVIISSVTAFARDCSSIREDVLRLHILANSDSQEDQDIKIMVRDAVLQKSSELFSGYSDSEKALMSAEQSLSKIEKAANAELERLGANYKAKAEICNMYFETRKYDNVSLPAGYYNAVRIRLGKAEGKNWWCVLFPALCIPAAQNNATINDVFSQSEINSVTQPKYEAKFAIIELIEWLKK